MKGITRVLLLILDLAIILFGLSLRLGIIACSAPPNDMYFLGPYLLLLTLLLSYWRDSRLRRRGQQ